MSFLRFALRADIIGDDFTSDICKFASKFDSSLVVQEAHSGENPHIHALLCGKRTLPAIRQAFKKAFPLHVGNGAYSVKECDDNWMLYVQYCCKGDSVDDQPLVLQQSGFDFGNDEEKDDCSSAIKKTKKGVVVQGV